MRHIYLAALATFIWSTAGAATLIPVPSVSGSVATTVFSINDKNQIAGSYLDSTLNEHAFFGTLDGNYTTFDYQTGGTRATAIDNNGDVIGYANFKANSACEMVPFERTAAGVISTIRKHNAVLSGPLTGNTRGLITGSYCNKKGNLVAYQGKNGKFSAALPIDIDSTYVVPLGLNSSGMHVGEYYDFNTHTQRGFLYQDGITTIIDYPDPSVVDTQLTGLNEKGIAVGIWNDGNAAAWSGFTLDTTTKAYTVLQIPNAKDVLVNGINRFGLAAVDTNLGPYIFCPTGAKCPSAGIPIETRTIKQSATASSRRVR